MVSLYCRTVFNGFISTKYYLYSEWNPQSKISHKTPKTALPKSLNFYGIMCKIAEPSDKKLKVLKFRYGFDEHDGEQEEIGYMGNSTCSEYLK